jgi:CheY-like chemotaxis protein
MGKVRAKILAVDDEPSFTKLVSHLLTTEGYEVDTAVNGIDALDKIQGKKYNLLLTGIRMPGMAGFELFECVRKIAPSLANKTIVISGSINSADTEEFLAKYKLPYFAKPFIPQQLVSVVNVVLNSERLNWFQRHLNWTCVFAWLLWFVINLYADDPFGIMWWLSLVAAIFWLIVSGWVIKRKGRRWWWFLLSWVASPLWLKNKSYGELTETKDPKAGFVQEARMGTGRFIQIIGWVVWLGCGLYIILYLISVIYGTFGFWLATLAFLVFPIAFVFAPFIDLVYYRNIPPRYFHTVATFLGWYGDSCCWQPYKRAVK